MVVFVFVSISTKIDAIVVIDASNELYFLCVCFFVLFLENPQSDFLIWNDLRTFCFFNNVFEY